MSPEPKISVLIPVYNVEEVLERCLRSVAQQTYKNLQVILVDDGSTDASAQICQAYVQADPRFELHRQQHQGSSTARNTLLSKVQSGLVAFIDSDDWVEPRYLEVLYRNLQDHQADISICTRQRHLSNGTHYKENRPAFSGRVLTNRQALRAVNSFQSFDEGMPGKIFRTELFQGIEFPVNKSIDDKYIMYLLLARTRRVFYENTDLYVYCKRIGSITMGSQVNELITEATLQQKEFFTSHFPDLIQAANTAVFFSALGVYNEYFLRNQPVPAHVSQHYRTVARPLLGSVLRNQDLSLKKKLQAVVFAFSARIYRRVFLLARKDQKL